MREYFGDSECAVGDFGDSDACAEVAFGDGYGFSAQGVVEDGEDLEGDLVAAFLELLG